MRMLPVRISSCASLLFLAAWVGPEAVAQSIKGTVFDPDGALVPKARVMLMQDYVKLKETAADEKGGFAFEHLAPGRYQVQIKQPMFSLFQQTVELTGTEPAVVYAVLPLARLSDGMRVSARLAPSVQRNRALSLRPARIGGKIEMAKLLAFPLPEYPPGPDARGVEGDVVIFAIVKADGNIADPVVVSSPDPDFEDVSMSSVRNWRYRPMRLNGRAVDTQIVVTLQFRLQ